jgi:hypothetical protein
MHYFSLQGQKKKKFLEFGQTCGDQPYFRMQNNFSIKPWDVVPLMAAAYNILEEKGRFL